MFSSLAQSFYAAAAAIPFDTLVWLTWGSFIAIYVLIFALAYGLPTVRASSKRPFLCLVNAYTAVTLAAFTLKNTLAEAIFVAAVFWVAGYLLYGLLCYVFRPRRTVNNVAPAQVAVTAAPVTPVATPAPARTAPKPPAPVSGVAKNNVRLEHAIAVCARLLEKNLGKTDRQELEKLKNTLEVLKVKGTLTPAEGEILNENFNTLLKLMAKYNV